MNLLEMRKLFRQLSGRFDLVNDDLSDNGCDFFINQGSKFLDRMDTHQKSYATKFSRISAGEIGTTFTRCRAIKEVWAASEGVGRWQLTKEGLQDLTASYLSSLPAEMNSGTPLYYAPCITRSVPPGETLSSFEEFLGYLEVSNNETNAILLNVPTSTDLTLIIHGLFYSPKLTAESDKNYWSEVHPMLLYMSAMRQVEISNRSTQGVDDWTKAILAEITQIGKDLVEEMIAEADQMEG